MTELHIKLLEHIKRHYTGILWIDVINAFDPMKQCNTVDDALRDLLSAKYIKITEASKPAKPPNCRIEISTHGLVILENNQQTNIDHKESKRNKQHKWNIDKKLLIRILSIIATLVTIISGIVTIIDYFAN